MEPDDVIEQMIEQLEDLKGQLAERDQKIEDLEPGEIGMHTGRLKNERDEALEQLAERDQKLEDLRAALRVEWRQRVRACSELEVCRVECDSLRQRLRHSDNERERLRTRLERTETERDSHQWGEHKAVRLREVSRHLPRKGACTDYFREILTRYMRGNAYVCHPDADFDLPDDVSVYHDPGMPRGAVDVAVAAGVEIGGALKKAQERVEVLEAELKDASDQLQGELKQPVGLLRVAAAIRELRRGIAPDEPSVELIERYIHPVGRNPRWYRRKMSQHDADAIRLHPERLLISGPYIRTIRDSATPKDAVDFVRVREKEQDR